MARLMSAGLRLGGPLLISAAIACAHGTLTQINPGVQPSRTGRIAAVSVTAAPSVDGDRRAVFDETAASDVISRAIVAGLEQDARYDLAGDTRIDVKITVFRLRSTGNAFWNGFLAGVDKLEGTVDVTRGDESPIQYSFKLSGSEELYFKFSRAARFRSLAGELAEKLLAAL